MMVYLSIYELVSQTIALHFQLQNRSDLKIELFAPHHQEDMNLSEEKKTPLRDKDLNKKREMVIQYICTASKTVSLLDFSYIL